MLLFLILAIINQVFQAAGRWLRTWIVIDAFVVLCGGVLTGKITPGLSISLIFIFIFWRRYPQCMRAPWAASSSQGPPQDIFAGSPKVKGTICVDSFILCLQRRSLCKCWCGPDRHIPDVNYAFNCPLSCPNIYRFLRFSLVWLTVMSLFPMTLLLLKFNRGRIKRDSHTPLAIIVAALAISAMVFAGNIAVEPATAGSEFPSTCETFS